MNKNRQNWQNWQNWQNQQNQQNEQKIDDKMTKGAISTELTKSRMLTSFRESRGYHIIYFAGDFQSRVMGYGVLRQIRVRPNSCRVHKSVQNLTQECAQGSIFIHEDDTNYCNAWEEKTELTEFLPSCIRQEFKFTSAKDLDSMSYTAEIDTYGGGGYVYRIKGSSKEIRDNLIGQVSHQHLLFILWPLEGAVK